MAVGALAWYGTQARANYRRSSVPDEHDFSPQPVRFGIIGCGAIGPTHAGAIAQIPDARLVAVADIVSERAAAIAQKFDVARVYADAAELLADSEVQAVCICTPSGMHADHAVAALTAGKHVLIEKPMDIALDACDRIIAAQRRCGKQVAVVCQHRFDAASMLIHDAITTGRLGRIVLVTADVKWWRTQRYYDSGDWRGTWALDGGGALMNQAVHTVDLLQWLAGDVVGVFGRTRTGVAHQRIEVEDVAVAVLEFAGGAVGALTASTACYDGLPARIDIFGTDGSAILEGDALRSLTLKEGQTFTSQRAAEHAIAVARGGTAAVGHAPVHRPLTAPPRPAWGDAHRAQIMDFIHAIRTNERPLIDAVEGRKAVAIILGIYQSDRTGQRVQIGGAS
jgi:predicted dehydrogenase